MGCAPSDLVKVANAPPPAAAADKPAVTAASSAESSAQAATATVGCHLRILHVNDVYLLDNLPALKACVDSLRKGYSNVLTTLAGDFLAPSLLSSIDHGRGMVDVMNKIPVDAVCFGNHEADVPDLALVSRINEFEGVWLNSNMRSFSDEIAELKTGACPDHHVVHLEGGRTVGLLGLCAGGGKDACLYRKGAMSGHAARITPVLEAASAAVDRAQAACADGRGLDCVVPLTHQDMADDRALCALGLPFPVILGGHEHEVFDEVHHGTRILKAGSDAFNVYVIDLIWEGGMPGCCCLPSRVDVSLVPLALPSKYQGPPRELVYAPGDSVLRALCARWTEPALELQAAVLCVREPNALSSVGVREGPSTMATELASALRGCEKSEGALINAGSVRGSRVYADGTVTFADLQRECPFPSEAITIHVKGRVLSEAVQLSRGQWPASNGMALHGDRQMAIDPATHAVTEVGGQPLDDERIYAITLDSYIVKANSAFAAYALAHPERIPPDDAGRPVLPMVVSYYISLVWKQLLDSDGDGEMQIASLFAEADNDSDGKITTDDVLRIICRRLGDRLASAVLARQCIAAIDHNQDGVLSQAELRRFFVSEGMSRAGHALRKAVAVVAIGAVSHDIAQTAL